VTIHQDANSIYGKVKAPKGCRQRSVDLRRLNNVVLSVVSKKNGSYRIQKSELSSPGAYSVKVRKGRFTGPKFCRAAVSKTIVVS